MNLRFLPESHTDFVLAVTPGLAFFGLALCLMSACGSCVYCRPPPQWQTP